MADFTIVRPEPFVVEGVNGDTYELPRVKDMSAAQVAAMAPLADATETEERIEAVRAFILALCPALADEPLTDMGYASLFGALAEGSDVSMGES